MKPRRFFKSAASVSLITVACSVLAANLATAASQTWDGDTDAQWATASNWVGNAVPGIIYTANNTNTADVATFNAPITLAGNAGNPVLFLTNRMIGRIVFDTANAGAYAIGDAVGSPTLTFGNNLTVIDETASVVNPQTFNAPVALHLPSSTNGAATIQNNSTTTGATLTLAGGIVNSPNSSRGTTWTLRGTNTGENTVSGSISITNTGGQNSSLTKADTGTWVLSGANTFSAGGGVIVTDGLLAAASNTALGTNATANAQNAVINGGVLEIRNGVTIDNGVSLNFNAGTIRGVGTSGTLGRVNVSTNAFSTVTLATVSAGDVFTLGDGANDFTGGAADSIVHITGPGTVFQPSVSNYAGTWSVDSGTLRIGSATSLGALSGVNVASGAKLQTYGSSPTLATLTGNGLVTNGLAGLSTVTLNVATTANFAGQMQDGVAGTLGLTKTGAGTLNLSGASNYTDATLISTGVLNLTGSLGNTAVSGSAGTTLSGTGTIGGGVTVDSNVHIAPGDGGNAAIGTLSTGALTLNSDAQLDFGITSTAVLDKILVTNSGGLSISGGQVNINGAAGAFTTNGTYPLIGYTGAVNGSVNSLSVNGLNKSVTKTYTFTASGGFVNLVVANSGVAQTFWNLNANGSWGTAANWTPATVPNATGAFAGFGGGGTEITADRTVTVNGAFTVGTLAFNNATRSYTLAAGTGANLTLNNGATGSFVTDTAGNHTINSPVTLTSNGATFTVSNAADTLAVGGIIGGSGTSLVKGGAGTLALTGANTYFADTTINGGALLINSAASLGDSGTTLIVNAGTLRTTADITSLRTFNFGNFASTISVAPGTTYTIDGFIQDGANVGILNKADAGTLVLNNFNSYSGGTVINAGTVKINNANSLGSAAGTVTLNDATLQATASITGSRNLILGSATSNIIVDPAMEYVIGGVISGSGTLDKTGAGTLTLGAANSYTGGTFIKGGTISVGNNGGTATLGSGTVTFEGGTLTNSYNANNTWGLNKPLFVDVGQTGTLNLGNRINVSGVVSGGGVLNVNSMTSADRNDLTGSWNTFTGQLNFAGTSNIRLLTQGGNFSGFDAAAVTMEGSVSFTGANFSGGATTNIGMLTGTSTTTALRGSSLGGQNTWSIGALNLSGTYAGQILGGNVVKVGTGTLTLAGINTYAGNTTINDGTLALADNGGLRFVIAANGVSNKVTGPGSATLDGDFTFDLTGADLTTGNTWTIVDVATKTFGSTFTVVDFTETANVWKKVDGANTWTFDEATGILSLNVGATSGYAAWATSKGLTAGTNDGPTQDPDFDGIANALEFVLGGNPLASETGKLPVLTTDANNFIFTFSRADESLLEIGLTFQYSSTLTAWTDVPITAASGGQVTVTENGTAPDTVVVTIPKSNAVGGKLFGRLKAVK